MGLQQEIQHEEYNKRNEIFICFTFMAFSNIPIGFGTEQFAQGSLRKEFP